MLLFNQTIKYGVFIMSKDTPAKLIDAAFILFAEKGFSAVTIREVAEASSTNSALISYYFGGKEGLYRAVLEQQFAKVGQALLSVSIQNKRPLERIATFAWAIINLHQTNPYLLRLVNAELSTTTPYFKEVVKLYISRNFEFICQAIREGIAVGEIREEIQPEYAALALAGIMNFYFLAKPLEQQFITLDDNSDNEYCKQAIQIYLNGIRRNGSE